MIDKWIASNTILNSLNSCLRSTIFICYFYLLPKKFYFIFYFNFISCIHLCIHSTAKYLHWIRYYRCKNKQDTKFALRKLLVFYVLLSIHKVSFRFNHRFGVERKFENGRKKRERGECRESRKQDAYFIMIIVLAVTHAITLDLPHCMFK